MCPQGQVSCSVTDNGPYKTSPGGSGTPSTSNEARDYYPNGKSGYMSEYELFGNKYYCIDAQKKGPLDDNNNLAGRYANYKDQFGCWVILVGECCDQGGQGTSSPNSKGAVPKSTSMPSKIVYTGEARFYTPDELKQKVGGCLNAYVVNPYCDGASQWVK
jgi:hypothetical protein